MGGSEETSAANVTRQLSTGFRAGTHACESTEPTPTANSSKGRAAGDVERAKAESRVPANHARPLKMTTMKKSPAR